MFTLTTVSASGVEIILEMDFVRFVLQKLEIHSSMIQIRTLSMILQTFSTTLHSPRYETYSLSIIEKIDIHFRRECESKIDELKSKFNGMSIEINKKKELQHLEQAAKVSSQYWKPPIFYDNDDDDDEEQVSIRFERILFLNCPLSFAISTPTTRLRTLSSWGMRN
ncbi:hypothetical protein Tco_1133357 [Tanacetum coccineum]|uniref:Uncharacterized protein n=1 Tax=Tanacetum coccineum TaxID=301880 RepID=A0ABQ4Z0T2_9ASTR